MLCAGLAGVGYLDPSAACSRAGVREGRKATAMLGSLTKERRCFSCWILALRTGKVIADVLVMATAPFVPLRISWDASGCGCMVTTD